MASKDIIAKYNLPSMDALQAELGFFEVEKDEEFVETILTKLRDRVSIFIKVVEDLLHPDSSIVSMQEAAMFSNREQEQLFELYKAFATIDRQSLLVQLDNSDEAKAKYFNDYFTFWQSKKERCKQIITQAIAVWKGVEQKQDPNNSGYFG